MTTPQKWAAAGIVAAALALAGIGLYLSFEHVAGFAFDRLGFGTLRQGQLFTGGVDTGIMVLIAIDLLMAWLRRPVGWIRYPVWLLTAATVVLNAASAAPKGHWGWLDYVAVAAHGIVPVLFIVVVDVGRDSIDRVVRPERAERDSIPLIRWLLAPVRTGRVYRRMRLYDVHSYPEMVRRDQELIAYELWLKRKYDGDLSAAGQDELLPMTMAPYGYTVARALAMPAEQEQAAEIRDEEAALRKLEAGTRRRLAETAAQAEALRADGALETVRAAVDGETGQARAHAQAQVTAAERAAAKEEEALESALVAEARARTAAAESAEAKERTAVAAADRETARLELAAAEDRRKAADADKAAAAEAAAIDTQTIAVARKAAAEADERAAETEQRAAEARLAVLEIARREAEEIARRESAAVAAAQSREAAAEAERRAAETRLATAEIERLAVEAEDVAKLTPRQRAVRKVARMCLRTADPETGELRPMSLPLADIQRELDVSSSATASEYRVEAAELLAQGYRP
ncbi:DUF2637 domain-containing protein (plasmid) [Kitasatospora griseola]|uniref:DUF2637 domain-containing protein n=1 Tax=Kitasatospora griseola TaxID=2064 RepID=UPI003855D8A5